MNQIEINKFTCTWEIGLFFRSTMYCKKFTINKALQGNLCLFSEESVSVFLNLESTNEQEIWVKFNISIPSAVKEKSILLESTKLCKFVGKEYWGFKDFIKTNYFVDEENGFVEDGEFLYERDLPIVLEVSIFDDNNKILQHEVPECCLAEDFWQIFENQELSDLTLTVDNKEFPTHKAILSARSPVFSAMLKHKMQESEQNRINIIDIDPNVVQEMLYFIYTDKAPNLETMAEDLLAAANKYQLEKLKIMCGKAICGKLTIDNAVNILLFADLHCADQLKTNATLFISRNIKDVMETEEFKSMLTSHPNLVAEIFRVVATIISMFKRQDACFDDTIDLLKIAYVKEGRLREN